MSWSGVMRVDVGTRMKVKSGMEGNKKIGEI